MSDITRYEAEAAAARARISGAIEELSDRLSPQTIMREAKAEGRKAIQSATQDSVRALLGVRDGAADALDEVEQFIVENPVAVGLAAATIGVAVTLGTRAARPPSRSDDYERYAEGDSYAAEALTGRASGNRLGARARETASEIADRASAVASRAREAAARTAHGARDTYARLGEDIRDRASDARDMLSDRLDAARQSAGERLDKARHAADEALTSAAGSARAGVRATGDAITENPETAVVLALAGGVLLALAAGDRGMFGSED